MKTLIVTKVLPLPANDGGKLRSLAVTRAVARRGEVVLCAFDDGSADIQGLVDLGVEVRSAPLLGRRGLVTRSLRAGSVAAGRFWSPAMADQVSAAAEEHERFDVALVEYAQLWPYVREVRASTRVLGSHNVESALIRSYGEARGPWRGGPYRLEAAALRRLEARAVSEADVVTVISQTDRKRLPGHPRRVLVCPNGWTSQPVLPAAEAPVVAFVALLGWTPNVDAAVYLTREVWPLVRSAVAGAHLLLVGRDPAPSVRALAAPDVEVTGTVADVRPHLARARVAVAPLRAGSGSRLKVLEALDAGRPVVGTSKGLEGLEDLVGRGAVVADGAAALAGEIARLLNDRASAEALGRRGHDAVASDYSWDQVLSPLVDGVFGREPRVG